MVKVIPSALPEVRIIEPSACSDERGYFLETYSRKTFGAATDHCIFVQDNESSSPEGVLRGLHYQVPPYAQSKLVRAIVGEILDVAVDIRIGSPTFGRYVSLQLSSQNRRQLFIPKGFAHGFLALSRSAVVGYKVDAFYSQESERSIHFADPQIAIDWKSPHTKLILSLRDKEAPLLKDQRDLFVFRQ